MTQDIHRHRLLILDFGSQYTQLIARRIREVGVYCEIIPWDSSDNDVESFAPSGIILSGGQSPSPRLILPEHQRWFSISMCRFLGFATACKPWPRSWAER